ncbi:MAG: hypothetical protein V1663_00935 [archaeon]
MTKTKKTYVLNESRMYQISLTPDKMSPFLEGLDNELRTSFPRTVQNGRVVMDGFTPLAGLFFLGTNDGFLPGEDVGFRLRSNLSHFYRNLDSLSYILSKGAQVVVRRKFGVAKKGGRIDDTLGIISLVSSFDDGVLLHVQLNSGNGLYASPKPIIDYLEGYRTN